MKQFKIVGSIYGPDGIPILLGAIVETVEGDLTKQVKLLNSKRDWFPILGYEKLVTTVPANTLQDPLYAANVWKEVFVHMRKTPPDFKEADKEKNIVEEAQRARAKENPEKVQSQFGFTCKTH